MFQAISPITGTSHWSYSIFCWSAGRVNWPHGRSSTWPRGVTDCSPTLPNGGAVRRHPALSLQPVSPRLLRLSRARSEEHTSELQSLMRNSYAVFCLKKKKKTQTHLVYTI